MAAEHAAGRAFAEAAGTPADAPWVADVDAQVHRLDQAARMRWPRVQLDVAAFAAHLGARVGQPTDVLAALGTLHPTDLFLACACAQQDPAALRAFDREYLQSLGRMLARLNPPRVIVEDVAQHLRDRLLLATADRPPGISKYGGRGKLAGFIKVVAMREAMARLQRRAPTDEPEEVAKLAAPGHDPEFDLMRQRYGDAFRASFTEAVQGLQDRERTLLRGHLVERLSLEQLGALHDVHRATAARWLAAVRQRLYESTRDALTRRLDIEPDEYESILRIIGSQLQVTVGGKLR